MEINCLLQDCLELTIAGFLILGIQFVVLIYVIVKIIKGEIKDYQLNKLIHPPKKRKSFKERLAEKQSESAKHHGLHQPINKVDTSNPPKETGT